MRKSVLLILLVYFAVQLLTFRTGVGNEEFNGIQIFRQVNSGLSPYEDVSWLYGIAGLYIWSSIIRLIGSELILLRLVAILIGAISIPFVYDISKRIMTNSFSLLAAFCCSCLFIFPSYSFNHFLSVLSIIIAVWYSSKFFWHKKIIDLLMWGVFLGLTFFIRPLPSGIALFFISLFVMLIFSLRNNYYSFLKSSFFLFSPFIIFIIFFYFVTDGLFFRYDLMTFNLFTELLSTPFNFRLPNTIRLITDFIYAGKLFNFSDINTIYRIVSFLGFLSGHIAYWLVFIIPTLYLVFYILSSIIKKTLKGLSPAGYLIVFLSSLNFMLGFYFQRVLLEVNWLDPGSTGLLWLRGAAQHLLQPGIIVSIYLLYRFNKRLRRPFLVLAASGIIVSSLVLIPKVFSLRYMIRKMPLGEIPGIRGIYMNNFYEKAVVPAIDYIEKNKNEYLFVVGYFPAFYVLTDKKPIIPEWVGIDVAVNPAFPKDKKKKYLFPGKGKELFSVDDLDNIILNRLRDKLPSVIHVYGDLSKDYLEWVRFFKDNYHPVKTFTYEHILKGQGDNPRVTIYQPNQR